MTMCGVISLLYPKEVCRFSPPLSSLCCRDKQCCEISFFGSNYKATEHFSWLAVRTISMNSNLHTQKKNFMEAFLALYKNLSDASGQ